jgi:hypothetical protein
MKKNIFTLSCGLMLCASLSAQTVINQFPYSANWKYQDGQLANDANKGTYLADSTLYDLGGWSVPVESGIRPFYISVSSGAEVGNALEFVDGQQAGTPQISYIVSPVFDFSDKGYSQVITFKCGHQSASAAISNLELLYTTEYTGNPATTEWTSLKDHLIPADQAGLGDSKLASVSVTADITSPTAVLAIRAAEDEDYTGSTSTQTKIRVTTFKVALTEKEVVETLPYNAKWSYKAELVNPADSTFIDQTLTLTDQSYWDLGGWSSVVEAKTKYFGPLNNSFTIDGVKIYRQVPNTVEWTDGCRSANTKDAIAWFISPKIDFSGDNTKYITFQVGKEVADQLYSNISLYYSTDYAGDYSKATWTLLQSNLVPADQAGLDVTTMTKKEIELALNAPTVTLAFKGAPQDGGTIGGKQTKIRIRELAVSTEKIETGISTVTAQDETEGVSVYPTAANDLVNIASAKAVKSIDVVNISGQTVARAAGSASQISVAQLPAGFYTVVVHLADGTQAARRIIKK